MGIKSIVHLMSKTSRLARILLLLCPPVAIAGGIWLSSIPDDPNRMRIGTAFEDGAYEKIGFALAKTLNADKTTFPGINFEASYTRGSVENSKHLAAGKLELAIIQSDVPHKEQVLILKPLYQEYLHIIVNRDKLGKASTMKDLAGHAVAVGPKGSGTRMLVQKLLNHYKMNKMIDKRSYDTINDEAKALKDGEIAALCRVAGRPDLMVEDLLKDERMGLISVGQDVDLEKFTEYTEGYHWTDIEGYRHQSKKIKTVTVTALLMARADLSKPLVYDLMRTYDEIRPKLLAENNVARYLKIGIPFEKYKYHHIYHPGARAYQEKQWFIFRPVYAWIGISLAIMLAIRVLLNVFRMHRISKSYSGTAPQDLHSIKSSDVFISYHSSSKLSFATVERISAYLEMKGMKCWYAPRDISSGDPWPGHITAAIEHCRYALIVVFTEEVNDSNKVLKELILASEKELKICPFLIEDAKPKGAIKFFLADVQWIRAFPKVGDEHLVELWKTLPRVDPSEKERATIEPKEGEKPSWRFCGKYAIKTKSI